MKKIGFSIHRDFKDLSVRDLLDAREHYHAHLSNKENVVATAIGKYLIRATDPDSDASKEVRIEAARAYKKYPPRTLANSGIKDWSWPCVLVFVSKWFAPEEFAEKLDQAVPRFLYLPDGRVVPTCVVVADAVAVNPEPLSQLRFPDQLMGGGFPVFSEVQGSLHVGSIGCLVSDGNLTFALTNRHVAGPEGAGLFALIDRSRQLLGFSDRLKLSKHPIEQVYPGYPSSRAVVNLDAGLVRVEDVNQWSAQVFGIGEIGPTVDLNTDTISLDLIGARVMAFGGVSALMEGQVQALFYRYNSIGGCDYITDFLIGSRDGEAPLATKHGDSGTLWFLDEEVQAEPSETAGEDAGRGRVPAKPRPRPLALQWGGHRFLEGGGEGQFQFALASNLSAICRLLDVEVVRDWNRGLPEFWGQLGHYKIGFLACGLLSSPKAKRFFAANAERVGISDSGLLHGAIGNLNKDRFVPLADVPDDVWRDLNERTDDNSNHFADMDQEGAGEFAGRTLLDLCKDEKNISVEVWNRFYTSLGASKRGAVPFRVWQIYTEMVKFVRARELDKFLCAAGILAHYVGDCGQPLHISQFHHGRPDHPSENKVHTVYETTMLSMRAPELIEGLRQAVSGKSATARVKTGRGAAIALIELMRNTIELLPPMEIIDAYNGTSGAGRVALMWDRLGERTVDCIADALLLLATLWESAWEEGGGNEEGANSIPAADLGEIGEERLRELYMTKEFIQSYTLQQLEAGDILR